MKIKERQEEREKIEEILKEAGAKTFEEKYWKLWSMYLGNDKKKYNGNMEKQIEKMHIERHEVYASIERNIRRRSIKRKCASCGKIHMVNMADQHLYVTGQPVKFLCSICRPKRMF